MMTAMSALRWEIGRNLRERLWANVFAILIVPAFTALPVVAQLVGRPAESPLRESLILAHMVMTIINLVFCLVIVGQAIGMPVRQYTLPVSSQMLATARLAPGAVYCAGFSLLVSNLMNFLFRAEWPCFGPALTFGVSFMVMYTVVYSFRDNQTRIGIAVLCMEAVLISWIGGHYGPRWWIKQDHIWIDFSATELVILSLAAVVAWRGLVNAIERDRHGAGWGRASWKRVAVGPSTAKVASNVVQKPLRKFLSPMSALFWHEWKHDGWMVPGVVCGLMSLVAIFNIGYLISDPGARRDGHDLDVMSLVSFFIPICVIVPWLANTYSSVGKRSLSNQLWPTSQSTLPVSDSVLGWVMLARCLASMLVSLVGVLLIGAIWFVVTELILRLDPASVQFGIRPKLSGLPRLTRSDVGIYVAQILFFGWLSAGLSTAAVLSGRRWIAAIPLASIPVGIGVLLVFWRWVDMGSSWMVGCLAMWMIVAYLVGAMSGVVGWRSCLVGVLVLVIAESVGITLWSLSAADAARRGYGRSDSMLTVAMIFWSLAAAPPALIPLATYYNRHR